MDSRAMLPASPLPCDNPLDCVPCCFFTTPHNFCSCHTGPTSSSEIMQCCFLPLYQCFQCSIWLGYFLSLCVCLANFYLTFPLFKILSFSNPQSSSPSLGCLCPNHIPLSFCMVPMSSQPNWGNLKVETLS